MSGTYQAALASIAQSLGCSQIQQNDVSEFARLWIWCAVYGLAMIAGVTVPLYWCFVEIRERMTLKINPDKDAEKKAEEGGEDAEEDDPDQPKKLDRGANRSSEPVKADDPKPDKEKAIHHLRKSSPTDSEGKWRGLWRTKITHFAEIGGTGTELYFRLLRNLGLVFIYMSAITSPICAYNIIGNFAPDTGQALLKTTIGNLGQLTSTAVLAPESRLAILSCQGVPLTLLTKYFGWLDWVAIVIFLIFMLYFRFVLVPRKAKEDDEAQITCKDFAIMIDKLPRKIDEQEKYKEELEKLLVESMKELRPEDCTDAEAKVCEIVLVRDFSGRLSSIRGRADMERSRDIAQYKAETDEKYAAKHQKVVDKLDMRISKVNDRLAKKLDPDELLPVVRAYVILNTQADVERLLFEYRLSRIWIVYQLQRLCGCCGFKLCKGLRFKGTPIRLQQAPEPSNIIWENQDVSWINRSVRQCIMLIIFLILIAISLVLIYACSVAASSQSATQQSYIGAGQCDPAATVTLGSNYKCNTILAKNWTTGYVVNASNTDITNCYCQTVGYGAIFQTAGLESLCQNYIITSVRSSGITIGASVIVVVINVLVKTVLIVMAYFEKPVTETDLTLAVTRKIALAQTINTGFVVLLVNYNAPTDLRIAINRFPLGGQLIFAGNYPDFVRSWYAFVGTALLTNMVANAVTAPITNVVMVPVNSLLRWCSASKAKHHAELLELYTNPPFDLTVRFAQLIMTVYVTLTYSSGLPALNLFAAGYMFFTYWSDKLVLLWGSKRPPFHDSALTKEVSTILLYAVPIHLIFSCMMYGQPCTFPSNEVGYSNQLASATGSSSITSNFAGAWIYTRISRESTWMHFALLVLIVALWVLGILYFLFAGTLGSILRCFANVFIYCCCWCKCCKHHIYETKTDTTVVEKEGTADNTHEVVQIKEWAQAQILIEENYPPASYELHKSPAFMTLEKYLRDGALSRGSLRPSDPGSPNPAGSPRSSRSTVPVSPVPVPDPEALRVEASTPNPAPERQDSA